MAWSLHTYNIDKPQERSGAYFRGRLVFYSIILGAAGFAQFLLGTYCAARFEAGTLQEGPVSAAFLIVSYPGIAILVGGIQFLNGMWGIARSFGLHSGSNDNTFSISLALGWVLVLSLQVIAQIGYLPEGTAAPVAPTVVAFSLGLNVLPAFLDQKMRSLPEQFPADYYKLGVAETTTTASESPADVETEDNVVSTEMNV
jgi:hypothetical protein